MIETKREAYIRRIENALKTGVTEITHEIFFTEDATREILELLKEQPERKKGKWILQDYNKTDGFASTAVYYYPKCSVCGHCANSTNFCPNCGADMRGERND